MLVVNFFFVIPALHHSFSHVVILSHQKTRKDRYNKKLRKYCVVYEENDTELSEDEERHEKKDAEAPDMPERSVVLHSSPDPSIYSHRWSTAARPQVDADEVEFSRLGRRHATPSDSEGDSEQEEKAEQVNTAAKDFSMFYIGLGLP